MHDSPMWVKDRVILPFHEGFAKNKTLAKISEFTVIFFCVSGEEVSG